MLQSDTEYELGKFLKGLENFDSINLTLAGAVISGQYLKMEDDKIITLSNSTVHTGGNSVETNDISIPREKVIAWGYNEE